MVGSVIYLIIELIMRKIPCLKEELEVLEKELFHLTTVERPDIIKAIAAARALGDLSENAEYISAREKQSFIEGRIQELTSTISACEVVSLDKLASDQVQFGATVTLLNLDTNDQKSYKIVNEFSANPQKGFISYLSPLARELLGKKQSDIIDFTSGRGEQSFEILKIVYQ